MNNTLKVILLAIFFLFYSETANALDCTTAQCIRIKKTYLKDPTRAQYLYSLGTKQISSCLKSRDNETPWSYYSL
jgi:hypothetical protein